MIKNKLLTTILTVGILIGTSGMAMAQGYNYNYPPPQTGYSYNYPPPQYKRESPATHRAKKTLKYGLIGAGAGYVLSGHNHRGTNVLKGAAIGSAAGLLTGR